MLQIDAEDKIKIEPFPWTAPRMAILGISGSGKSNTAAVVIEEMLPHVPMTIIDVEGEMWGLKERFDILVAGCGDRVDLSIGVHQAAALAAFCWEHNLSLILDVSDFDLGDREEFLLAYLQAFWESARKLPKPHMLLVEEAHELVPQNGQTDLKSLLIRLALQGRKRGVGMIFVSQRSSKVSKDVLTQCGRFFLHRVMHPADMAVYKEFIPWKSAQVEKVVRGLRPGQVVFVDDEEPVVAQVRLRHTFHAGATPGLAVAAGPELRKVDAALLVELRELLADDEVEQPDPSGDDEAALRKTIADLEMQNANLKAQLERAEKRLALVKIVEPSPEDNSLELPDSGGSAIAAGSYRSPLATTRGVNRQRRGFEALLRDVEQQPVYQRRILTYLMEREGRKFTADELARYLGLSPATIKGHPPVQLIKLGLIERSKATSRGHFHYAPSARATLARMFPDLAVDELVDELIGLAPEPNR